ncbi:LuxR C-terminal-related transcriptional regulator [Sphaerotilus microaerophilus]|uniref:LuxR C-terminal-related transcriptional regulator n=1 Tax=Sphaerotilus microaerophilus TaxID=2914710 RepID=UPI002072FF52|nr:response regulator transcription factor [Sphaerotilus sp. FB-5]
MRPQTALLIDPHTLWRVGLGLLLREHFADVEWREAPDVDGALLQAGAANLVLVDPEAHGLTPQAPEVIGALLRRCRARWPGAAVVALIDRGTADQLPALLAEGVDGLIAKTAKPEAIVCLLQELLGTAPRRSGLPTAGVIPGFDGVGGQAISVPRSAGDLAAEAEPPSSDAEWGRLGLSGRQLDVLRLLSVGLTNKAISQSLGLAESTVKTHVLGLFHKLGLASRTEAALWAATRGLSQAEPPPAWSRSATVASSLSPASQPS